VSKVLLAEATRKRNRDILKQLSDQSGGTDSDYQETIKDLKRQIVSLEAENLELKNVVVQRMILHST
jgi:hypothetical protein